MEPQVHVILVGVVAEVAVAGTVQIDRTTRLVGTGADPGIAPDADQRPSASLRGARGVA